MREFEFLYTALYPTLQSLLFGEMTWLNTDAFSFLSSEALFHHKMKEKNVTRINKFTKINRVFEL